MTTAVAADAPERDYDDGGQRPFAAAAWTDEQTAYALFLKNACVRLEVIAVEIGIEPHLVDGFVRDAVFIIHQARHTLARDRQPEVWIEGIAHNLGRGQRYNAAMRRRRQTIFWSLRRFVRAHRYRRGYAEVRRLTSEATPPATTM